MRFVVCHRFDQAVGGKFRGVFRQTCIDPVNGKLAANAGELVFCDFITVLMFLSDWIATEFLLARFEWAVSLIYFINHCLNLIENPLFLLVKMH